MGGLDHLTGRSYGPFSVDVSADRVAEFVAATGDDPPRWSGHAPPMFANVALFGAAPAFLEDPEVLPHTRSLIHSDQSYRWSRALKVGDWLSVSGRVTSVRERSGLSLVTFAVAATSSEGPWLESTSTFLLSAEAAVAADDEAEPPALHRAGWDEPTADLSARTGSELTPFTRSASRMDLVRYAGATRDWNPIHWDHDAARAAGLSGVIVHGLLMASWMAIAGQQLRDGPHPLGSLSVRFRKPLRPAVAATVSGTVGAAESDGVDVTAALEAGGAKLVTASLRVTR